jgi:AcrR family transcriptional regulator
LSVARSPSGHDNDAGKGPDEVVTYTPVAGVANWHPRRLEAVSVALPDGVTPPGTRGRILHAALRLFSEYGFHGSSIRQIAAEVGINPATLYAHYPSKEHILAELVLVGHQELDRRLRAALASAPASAAAGLAALVRQHALIHCDYPLLALVANTELHALTTEAAAPALQLRAGCRRLLAEVLTAGAASGEFTLIDPDLTAIAIGGLGMQVAHWFAPGGPFTPDQVADAYAHLALRMVGAVHGSEVDTKKGRP